MELTNERQMKGGLFQSIGMLLIAVGLAILIFAVDYAYQNVLSGSNAAWEQIYGAFVILAWLFDAVLFGLVIYKVFSSLAGIADAYRKRR